MSLRIAPEPAAEKDQPSTAPERFARLRQRSGRRLRASLLFWVARPDALLLVLLAAILRLSALHETTFLGDQAQIFSLGQSALLHHALPVTGIRSSIGTMNMPASIYLLLPFILLNDPFWATLFTALANIAAVMLLYALTNRYVGRRAALVAGLLYATAPWAVFFSRFIWQQNLLAPIVLLLIWMVCRGTLEGKRGWLGWSLFFWGIALQLHPSAAPLITLIAFGVLLSWRRLRWRDLFYSALALLVLFVPPLLWELASNGYDVGLYIGFARQPARYNLDVVRNLFAVLTPPRLRYFGEETLYYRFYPALSWLSIALIALYSASTLWLLIALVLHGQRLILRATGMQVGAAMRSPRQAWRSYRATRIQEKQGYQERTTNSASGEQEEAQTTGNAEPTTAPNLAHPANGRMTNVDWRFLVIMLLWQVSPVVSMLKHPKPIQEHYLLVLLPALFLMIGMFFAWLEEYTTWKAIAWSASRLTHRAAEMSRSFISLSEIGKAFLLILAVLTAAQSFSSVAMILTLNDSAYTGPLRFTYTHYGFPLEVQQDALATAYTTAQINQARLYVATTWWQQQSLGYLAASSNMHANVYDAGSCLTMPSAGSAPAVVLATAPLETTDSLATMPGVTVLRTIGNPAPQNLQEVTDTPALTLYSVPAGSHLSNEIAVPVSAKAAKQTHLVAYASARRGDGAPQLVLHWSGAPPTVINPQNALNYWYGAQPEASSVAPADYWFMAQPLDSSGHPIGAPAVSNCTVLFWGANDDIYTWLDLPQISGKKTVASWKVWITQQTMQVSRPTFAGITLETANVTYTPMVTLPGAITIPALR